MYNFEDLLDRSSNGSKKWNIEYIKRRFPGAKEKIYPLFIADMDYKLPEEIMNSFIDFISKGDFGYFDILDDFNDSIINWYKKVQDIAIKDSWIVPGIGTITSIKQAIAAIKSKSENILIFTPVYGPFRDVVIKNNCNLVTYPLSLNEKEYIIDFNKLENYIIKNNVTSILFCNPHNPSGRIWDINELNNLIHLCKKYNLKLFVDEVHSDLIISNKKFISIANYFNQYKNIIISSAPNKTFNLAGLNASYLLTPNEEFKNLFQEELSNNKLTLNRIGYKFLTICYENGEQWVYELRNNIKENYNIVKDILADSDIKIIEPQASYLLWIKINKVENIDKFVVELAQKTGVLLETGSRFIDNYEGFIRINLATSKEILREAMIKIVKFLEVI